MSPSEPAQLSPGRLRARRPATPPARGAPTGLWDLAPQGDRATLLYVPTSYRPDHPAPLVVMFHGAGSEPRRGIAPFLDLAEAAGLVLLAPASSRRTWDVILGGYGPDVSRIDQALALVFNSYAIDPAHIAAAGFSDGASYALSLGLHNGDLFTHVVAFSPGFMASSSPEGKPAIYVSHGTRDEILPIEDCSRKVIPQLRDGGYDVCYREFDGPHTVPPEIAREASAWMIGAASGAAPGDPSG